jgi:hypothetical protein
MKNINKIVVMWNEEEIKLEILPILNDESDNFLMCSSQIKKIID